LKALVKYGSFEKKKRKKQAVGRERSVTFSNQQHQELLYLKKTPEKFDISKTYTPFFAC